LPISPLIRYSQTPEPVLSNTAAKQSEKLPISQAHYPRFGIVSDCVDDNIIVTALFCI